MGFSTEWEELYVNNNQMSIWPWSDLVSYIYRYTEVAKRPNVKVLEIGCGAGANIPLFQKIGADYCAVDGSPTVIKMLQENYPIYANNLVVGDFTKEIPFDETFDVIVDRASLTHNTTADIKKTIDLIEKHLTSPNGIFIGVDWFSKSHDDFILGDKILNDPYTKYMGNVKGQFAGVGNVHFSDDAHLIELFSSFEIKVMEEKVVNTLLPVKHRFASWNFVAVKKD